MDKSNIESEKPVTPSKRNHKSRTKKRNFTFVNKKTKNESGISQNSKNASEVFLKFDYSSLSFKTTKPLSIFQLTKEEKDLMSDMLTDIEQENNLRLYKYLHNILLLIFLFLGCALYFTIVVPILCGVFILYLLCKKKNFRNSIFEKIKQSMIEIEDEYNQLLDRFFVVIYVSNGEIEQKKSEKSKEKKKKIMKEDDGKKSKKDTKVKDFELKLSIVRKNFDASSQGRYLRWKEESNVEKGSESSRPLNENQFPKINIFSPSNVELELKKRKEKQKEATGSDFKASIEFDSKKKKSDDQKKINKKISIVKKKIKKVEKKKKKETEKKFKKSIEDNIPKKIEEKSQDEEKKKSRSIAKIEADMKRIESEDDIENYNKASLCLNLISMEIGEKKNKKSKNSSSENSEVSIEEKFHVKPSNDSGTLRKDFQSFSQEVISSKKIGGKKRKEQNLIQAPKKSIIRRKTPGFPEIRPSLTPQHKSMKEKRQKKQSLGKSLISQGVLKEDQEILHEGDSSGMISGFKKNEFTSSFVRENLDSPNALNEKLKGKNKKKSSFHKSPQSGKVLRKGSEKKKELSDIKEEGNFLKTFGDVDKIKSDSDGEFMKIGDDEGGEISRRMISLRKEEEGKNGASRSRLVEGNERRMVNEG